MIYIRKYLCLNEPSDSQRWNSETSILRFLFNRSNYISVKTRYATYWILMYCAQLISSVTHTHAHTYTHTRAHTHKRMDLSACRLGVHSRTTEKRGHKLLWKTHTFAVYFRDVLNIWIIRQTTLYDQIESGWSVLLGARFRCGTFF